MCLTCVCVLLCTLHFLVRLATSKDVESQLNIAWLMQLVVGGWLSQHLNWGHANTRTPNTQLMWMCVCFIVHLNRGIRHVEQRSIAYKICCEKKSFPCDVAFSDGHHQFSVHRIRTAIKKTKKIFLCKSITFSFVQFFESWSTPKLKSPASPSAIDWRLVLCAIEPNININSRETKNQIQTSFTETIRFFCSFFCLFGFRFAHVAIAAATTTQPQPFVKFVICFTQTDEKINSRDKTQDAQAHTQPNERNKHLKGRECEEEEKRQQQHEHTSDWLCWVEQKPVLKSILQLFVAVIPNGSK